MPGNVLLTFEGPNYGESAHDALRLVSDRFLKIVRLKMKLFASGEVLGHLPLKRNDVALPDYPNAPHSFCRRFLN